MKAKFCYILFSSLLIGCNGNGEPAPGEVPVNILLENRSIRVSNQDRQFHLYLPGEPETSPIVLLLHGNGGSSDQILGLTGTKAPHKVWLDIAHQENIILVIPNGSIGPDGRRGWNDCRDDARTNPDSDDLRYISELIGFVQDAYGSTDSPVYSVGTSNGGFMSMRLAAEIPAAIDAIAIIVASKPVNSECIEPGVPVSALFMNGTQDPILPYNGGQIATDRGEVFSTAETVNYWIERNQTDTTPTVFDIPNSDSEDESTVYRYSYRNGIGDTVVEHYEVVNGGHTEPSIKERYGTLFKLIVGNQNGDIEMATEIWEFLKLQ